MGVFSRLRDIINSNINAMLEKAEDPEKLIKVMIQEMEDTLVEIKATTAGAMANTRRVRRALDQARKQVDDWDARATLAVEKGRDDLAREAILQKRRLLAAAEALEREVAECEELEAQYKTDIQQLEEKLQTTRDKHRMLVQRHTHARQSKRAREKVRKADHHDAFVRFENLENRIERMEAEADLVTYAARKPVLEDEFTALESEDEVEAELASVKKRVAARRRPGQNVAGD